MATLTKAKNVLELGSGYGYSAFWFSLAMGSRGKIIMTDGDPANRERAIRYFKKARLQSSFDFRVGDALTVAGSRPRGRSISFSTTLISTSTRTPSTLLPGACGEVACSLPTT